MSVIDISPSPVPERGTWDSDQLRQIVDRARASIGAQAEAVGGAASSGAAATSEHEMRTALALDARAGTVRADANMTVARVAAVSALACYGAFALFGPVGLVLAALGGYGAQRAWRLA